MSRILMDLREELARTDLRPLEKSDDALVTYIRERLPNAKTDAQRDAEILNNEHSIRRYVEMYS